MCPSPVQDWMSMQHWDVSCTQITVGLPLLLQGTRGCAGRGQGVSPACSHNSCCVVMVLTALSAGAPGAGPCCSWGSRGSFRLHLWAGHQVVEVGPSSEAPSLFPCCCRTRLGVPWAGVCFPLTWPCVCLWAGHRARGTVCDTAWQILPGSSAGCSVPVVCEHWQNLLAGEGGDVESSRSGVFQSAATPRPAMVSSALCT